MLPRLHSRSALLAHQDADDLTKEALDAPAEAAEHTAAPARYPYGLRAVLLFPLAVYPFAIAADLVLRLTWSAKLSSHLHAFLDGDRAIFAIEAAEMLRRWMWVFLRVEWEVVRERAVRAALPPGARMRRRAPDASTENEFELLGAGGARASAEETREERWRRSDERE